MLGQCGGRVEGGLVRNKVLAPGILGTSTLFKPTPRRCLEVIPNSGAKEFGFKVLWCLSAHRISSDIYNLVGTKAIFNVGLSYIVDSNVG